jgi:hypothetical protein
MATLLITRPDYELTTHYLSRWSQYVIDESNLKKLDLIDLTDHKAERAGFLGRLRKKSDSRMLVVINGHGNESEIAGQDHKTIISAEDASALSGKIVYARACNSINGLGQRATSGGAIAYIGYDIAFTFYIEDEKVFRPLEDKTAELFLEPSNYAPIYIIKGHPVEEANLRSRNKFLDNIKKILLEGPTSPYFYTIGDLYANMTHQILLGNGAAKL